VRYVGWYPRRRGILEHLEQGRIALLDAAVHDFLCLTADYKSGVAWASAEKIHVLAGSGISLRAIQRSLAKLEEIRWIKRFCKPGKRGNYPVLLGRYFVRDASLSWLSVNLERTTDWRDVQFDPVTDPTFVADGGGTGGVTEGCSEASPHQEVRSEILESRIDFDGDGNHDLASQKELASKSFEGFDLPKEKTLIISANLLNSLAIDAQRLDESGQKALASLQSSWLKSWKAIKAGELNLDLWIETAAENMKRNRIWYPPVLERRMYELRDGRISGWH
jgi:hypothetical protein